MIGSVDCRSKPLMTDQCPYLNQTFTLYNKGEAGLGILIELQYRVGVPGQCEKA